MKYRLLAFLTVIMLLCQSLFGTAVYAENDSIDSCAVKLLIALGIMDVDEDTNMFWDETPVERAEIAEILCNMFAIEATLNATPKFEDVPKEDRTYVETVVRNGFMSGYSDKRFGPFDYVTREQLVKIFVTVLNADKMAEALGGFPGGYVTVAKRIDLIDGVFGGSLSEKATRIEVANLIYAALHVDMPSLVGMSNDESIYDFIEGETFLTEMLDIYRYEGVMSKNEATSLDSPVGAGKDFVQIGDEVFKDENGITDGCIGSYLEVYVKKSDKTSIGEIIYAEEARNNTIVIVDADDEIKVDGFKISYYQSEKKREITLDSMIYMIYNGKAVEYDEKNIDVKCGYVTFTDNNGDKKYDVVSVTEYNTYVSDGVRAEDEVILLKYNEDSIKLEEDFYTIYKDGVKATLADIGIGDVLLVAASKPAARGMVYRIEVSTKYAMGSVNKTFAKDNNDYITIGNTDYVIGDYLKKLIKNNYQADITAGQSGKIFLDARGNVVYADLNSKVQNVGYLVDTAFIDNIFMHSMKIRIYTLDGKIDEYVTGDKLSVNGVSMEISEISSDDILQAKFKKPELVEYSETDGVIRRIDFPQEGYDLQNFSKDVTGNFKCTSTSVLDYKYNVTASTVVLRVPKLSERDSAYASAMNDVSNYRIASGSYFGRGNWYNNSKIYDVSPECEVKYVVIEYSPDSSEIWESHPLLAVNEVGEGIDNEGNEIKIISGYNENGDLVTFESGENVEKAVYDKGLNREITPGDVVQYRTDSNGKLVETKMQHSVDAVDYYKPAAIETWRTDPAVVKAYGEVISGGSTKIRLACKEIWEGMSPLDTDVLVSNTGKAVLCFDSTKNKFVKIDFDEIETGDKLFVCMNNSNYTKMIVIYE